MSVAAGGSDLTVNNTDNSFASDNSYATASTLVSLFNGQTSNLQATDFGFSIPATAIICGIQAEVEKSATNIGFSFLLESYVTDLNVRIMKNGTTIGTNKAASGHWTTTDTYTAYGGTNDKWGTTWLPADINASDFGISFSASINDLAGLMPVVRIDHIRITVYYYDPGVLTVPLTNFNVWNSYNNTAFLQWNTIDQNESARFSVERSTNAATWEPLNGIPQKNLHETYSYTDGRPLPGRSYYRLKMVTASGETKYSESKSFVLTTGSAVKCFPNPFTSYIQLSGVRAGEPVILTNLYGQRVRVPPVTANNPFQLDVSHLQPGIYFISVGNTKLKIRKW